MGMGLLGGFGCVGLVVCGGEMGVVWVCIIGFGRGCDGFGNRWSHEMNVEVELSVVFECGQVGLNDF